jgi:hypothetical protein
VAVCLGVDGISSAASDHHGHESAETDFGGVTTEDGQTNKRAKRNRPGCLLPSAGPVAIAIRNCSLRLVVTIGRRHIVE